MKIKYDTSSSNPKLYDFEIYFLDELIELKTIEGSKHLPKNIEIMTLAVLSCKIDDELKIIKVTYNNSLDMINEVFPKHSKKFLVLKTFNNNPTTTIYDCVNKWKLECKGKYNI